MPSSLRFCLIWYLVRIVQVFEKKLYFLSIYFDFTVPFALRFIFNMILSENFLSLRKNYIFWAYILILLRHPPWDFLNMILSENCSEKKLYFLSYCAICLEIFLIWYWVKIFQVLRKNYIFWVYVLILLRHPSWDFLIWY